MLFNSYFFVFIYLPVLLGVFYTLSYLNYTRLSKASLLLGSLFFYGYWDARFVPLLLGSIVFNFIMGNVLFKEQSQVKKKNMMLFAAVCNLALLFYFKYLNFFITSTNQVFSTSFSAIDIIFPLGISFFTFTQIAYLVDVYKKKATPGNLDSYGLFVTVFPHLIAGPVLHHKEMINQFDDPKSTRWQNKNIAEGVLLFTLGLSKKVLIADNVVPFVSSIFDSGRTDIPFIQAWVGAISYSIQLYFDFSGYSDMALGLGLFFNLKLPLNFNSPLQATSMIDFWRRWHISLSNFLRDYLYIPLGGNRKGEKSKFLNLFLTMLLGGIWHGAGWTFILWGVLHGLLLIINHLFRRLSIDLPNSLCHLLTLFCVVVTFTVFRSPDIEFAFGILKGMFGFNGIVLPTSYEKHFAILQSWGVVFKTLSYSNLRLNDLFIILGILIASVVLPNTQFWKEKFLRYPVVSGVFCSAIFAACIVHLDAVTEFLYYQF